MNRVRSQVRRSWQIASAFLRIDYIGTMNYPLALIMRSFSIMVPVVTFFFVSKLVVQNGPEVAFDYYTFAVIGLVTMSILGSTLNSFGNVMLRYVQEGQLEMFLVEPIRWRILPFVMVPWQAFMTIVFGIVMLLGAALLGADFRLSGVPTAVLIMLLGLASTLAIGILGASIRVLAKRADPVLAFYTIAASILSGSVFPIDVLPPALRALSWVIPHTYVIQALRRSLMPAGESLNGPEISQAIVALLIFCVVLYPIALWFLGRLLEFGRKVGALSGY